MTAARPSFATISQRSEPNPLVAEALALMTGTGGRALDLGAGRLNETQLLLGHGFRVDAVDSDATMTAIAAPLDEPRLNAVRSDIVDFSIEPGAYALIVAIHVLPFLTRADLRDVAASVIAGLASCGLLCCTLFGPEDEWAPTRPMMLFLGRAEVEATFSGLSKVVMRERRFDGQDAEGRSKRWHVHQCIFRKG